MRKGDSANDPEPLLQKLSWRSEFAVCALPSELAHPSDINDTAVHPFAENFTLALGITSPACCSSPSSRPAFRSYGIEKPGAKAPKELEGLFCRKASS